MTTNSKGETRPSTTMSVKSFVNGNTKANLSDMQAFIRNRELRRNQIVSLSSHETHIAVEDDPDADNELLLFYRENSILTGEAPLDNIQVGQFDNQDSWMTLYNDANAFQTPAFRLPNTLAIVRTPKAVGNARIQSFWYTSEATDVQTFTELITRRDGNWEGHANDVKEYLNDFIAPHQLVSITLFE